MSVRTTTRGQFLGLVLALVPVVALAAPSTPAPRSDPDSRVRRMIDAIRDSHYEGFVAEANDTFRSHLSKPQFEGVSGLFSARLQQGYKLFYLAKLRQQGYETFLWKLECADGKDEHLVKMSVKDGKVGGFLIQ